ncbi:hypothetical protein [Kaistella sp.]|uniref:hypothetical protein n=1 Tax=Kaistella sp. TaxID=2782235 RepID=UPI002F947F7E
MRKINKIITFFLLAFLTLVLNSCSKFTPSGFWKNFHSELIEKKSSDQGPFGGTREIEWENTNEKLKDIDFLKYANKKGWKLIDSINIQNKTIDKNNLKNLDEYSVEIIENEIVPKLSTSNSKIYVFETGWIRVKPGNNDETEQNGFLISESNEQKFKIIHNWGE